VLGPVERRQLQEWVSRLADGDREAFAPAFDLLWPQVRRFVGRQLPGPEAEDVAQQALLRLFERAAEFDPRRDALAWVLGIASYEVLSARKRGLRRRERDAAPLEELAAEGVNPEDAALERELHLALADAVGALSPADRETIEQLVGGARPGVAPATFRKRVERTLKRLRHSFWSVHGDR
jgi:RNA polymerase sigma factor (sigma-70 family)